MEPVCRIEIVIDARHSADVIGLLKDQEVTGWTLVPGASGSGERGARLGDDITDVSNNHVVLTTCAPDRLEALTESLRPLLKQVGGMCLVSEARWLKH